MKIYAHRGLKTTGHLENSAEAIRTALLKGYSVEMDLHLLGDETLICSHDPHIGPPYLPVKTPMTNLDYQGVKQLKCEETGSSIALAENIVPWMKEYQGSHAFWEIKHGGEAMNQRLLEVISASALHKQVTVIGYSRQGIPDVLKALANAGIKVGLIGSPFGLHKRAAEHGAQVLLTGYTEWWEEIFFRSLAPLFLPYWVRTMHLKGLEVVGGVINGKPAALYLKRCGFDGIVTDYPEKMRQLLA